MRRKQIRLGVLLGASVLVVLAILAPTTGLTQTDPSPSDTVTVTAAGTVEGRPDLASVSFGVRGKAATAQGAMEELSSRQNRVIDALRATGLAADQVTTGNVSLNAACHYDRDLKRTVCEGFVARTSVTAETRDLEAVGEIIDAGVAGGAGSVNNVSFERTEQSEAIKEALAEAMDLAMAKAEVLAVRAGRQLGRALVIEEGGARRPNLGAADEVYGRVVGNGAAGLVINPADRITRVRIVVTFALN